MRERRNLDVGEENDFNIFDTKQISDPLTGTTTILTALLAASARAASMLRVTPPNRSACQLASALTDRLVVRFKSLSTVYRTPPEPVAVGERSALACISASRDSFWWKQLVDGDTLRAWIVSMGRRDSVQRVAHLMCELYVRARNIGLIEDDAFELPLIQAVFGYALGLTAVHVNRVLRKLRLSGVMEFREGSVVVADIGKLAEVAGFDDNCLHRRMRRVA